MTGSRGRLAHGGPKAEPFTVTPLHTAPLHRLSGYHRGVTFQPFLQLGNSFLICKLSSMPTLMPFPGQGIHSLCFRCSALGTDLCLGTILWHSFQLLIQGKTWPSSLYSPYLTHSESSTVPTFQQTPRS